MAGDGRRGYLDFPELGVNAPGLWRHRADAFHRTADKAYPSIGLLYYRGILKTGNRTGKPGRIRYDNGTDKGI
jgi:hypothetical protein